MIDSFLFCIRKNGAPSIAHLAALFHGFRGILCVGQLLLGCLSFFRGVMRLLGAVSLVELLAGAGAVGGAFPRILLACVLICPSSLVLLPLWLAEEGGLSSFPFWYVARSRAGIFHIFAESPRVPQSVPRGPPCRHYADTNDCA